MPSLATSSSERGAMRILILEDDVLLAQGLKQGLRQSGHVVDVASRLAEAERLVDAGDFDLAMVDLGLPDGDGLDFIRRQRQRGLHLPILVLTARGTMEDTVRGLDAGADDYIVKPCRLPEVAARVRAVVRRSRALSDACLRHDALVLDTRAHEATLGGEPIDLTRREWTLLETLLMASPAVVSKDRLIQCLSGWDKDVTPNAIEVHVSRLRAKLIAGGVVIRTVRGIGYRVDAPVD